VFDDLLAACGVDGWRVVESLPTPLLLLTPRFDICGVNTAYLEAVARTREELVGAHLFDAFPDNPEDPDATGVRNLRASLERARDTGLADTMPVQRYDIPIRRDDDEAFEERFWSPVNVPVLDDAGAVAMLVHRVVDVTELVQQRRQADRDRERSVALQDRLELTQEDLLARAQALHQANEELRQARDREQRVALTLMEAMLPSTALDMPGLEVAVRYRPAIDATRVGGDWYDAFELGDGCVGLAVGDVMGHGLTAAGRMGQLRSALATAMHATRSPARALEIVGSYMASLPEAELATAVDVILDLDDRTLCYSSAGHPPPVLVRDGRVELLRDATSPPLGAPRDGDRLQGEQAFPSGSVLVLYTDGLVERRDRDIEAGLAKLVNAVAEVADRPAEAMASTLLELLEDEGHRDDVALVVVRG
jgi:serine phosphatase RsbU (regulator of sigma subunit)